MEMEKEQNQIGKDEFHFALVKVTQSYLTLCDPTD